MSVVLGARDPFILCGFLFSFQESIRLEVLTLIHFSFARSFSFINSFPFLCWTRMKECGICLTRWNFLDSLRTARSSGSHLFHSLFFPFSRARSRKGKRETAYETTIGIPSCPLRESEAGMKRKMEPMKRLLTFPFPALLFPIHLARALKGKMEEKNSKEKGLKKRSYVHK